MTDHHRAIAGKGLLPGGGWTIWRVYEDALESEHLAKFSLKVGRLGLSARLWAVPAFALANLATTSRLLLLHDSLYLSVNADWWIVRYW